MILIVTNGCVNSKIESQPLKCIKFLYCTKITVNKIIYDVLQLEFMVEV